MYLYSLWKKYLVVTLKLINKTTKDHIEIKKNVIDDSVVLNVNIFLDDTNSCCVTIIVAMLKRKLN